MICKAWTEGNAHIQALVEQYGLEIKPPLEKENWYLMVRGELIPSTGFAAEPETHSIFIKEIESEEEYWSALHEIGHCIDERARTVFFQEIRYPATRMFGICQFSHDALMDIEAAAWRWAIEHSMYDLTYTSARRISSCLKNYMDWKPWYGNRPHKIESDLLWTMLNF